MTGEGCAKLLLPIQKNWRGKLRAAMALGKSVGLKPEDTGRMSCNTQIVIVCNFLRLTLPAHPVLLLRDIGKGHCRFKHIADPEKAMGALINCLLGQQETRGTENLKFHPLYKGVPMRRNLLYKWVFSNSGRGIGNQRN